MLYAPSIDPVLLNIGPLSIRWYGFCYLLGFLGAYALCRWRVKKLGLAFSQTELLDIFSCAALGVLLGGRVWYLLFYQPWISPAVFLNEALQVWAPGRSFHGGLVGVVLAVLLYARLKRRSPLNTLDLLAFGTPVGIVFGRLGNFLNAELYGRLCDPKLPWAMVFPHVGSNPRHPSSLYEMILEGFLIAVLMLMCGLKRHLPPGRLTGLFLSSYALMRCIAEIFREPDPQLGLIWKDLSMGQLQSIPLLFIGILLFFNSLRVKHESLS